MTTFKQPQLFAASRCCRCPKMQQQQAATKRSKVYALASQLRERKIPRVQRFNEPRFPRGRQRPELDGVAHLSVSGGRSRERSCRKILRALLNLDAAIHRHGREGLRKAAGPADDRANGSLCAANAQKKPLRVLRQKSRASLRKSCLAVRSGLHADAAPDDLAVARRSAHTKGPRVASFF